MKKIDIFNTTNKYKVIYADPPWQFKTYSDKGKGKSADNHYPCMELEDIYSLPIGKIAEENSILFLWVTGPMIPEQIECMYRWGFTYKTIGFTWIKLNKKSLSPFIGLGFYTRSNAELCLIGTKGTPGRPLVKNVSQAILSPIGEHSQKPEKVANHIEMMYNGPRIELFARKTKRNWDCWGNETEKFNGVDLYDFESS